MAMRTSGGSTQLFTLRDFTGGLNLRSDTFDLQANESPDLLNVDVDRRGGFQVRRGISPYAADALTADPAALWAYLTASTTYVLAQVANKVFRTVGTTWTEVTVSGGTVTGPNTSGTIVSPVTFDNVAYWARGNQSVVKWDGGTNATLLGQAFNDTTTPGSGNVPRADFMAVHSGYMWVAGTWEGGVHYPNRVRWSWANVATNLCENWRSNDYIDIDTGKDSDAITAIVPYGDQMVVFKADSVYAIYGYSSETFSVVNISGTVGAVSSAATVATPNGLFFFDHQNGLNVYDGKRASWAFEPIWPAMRDGSIPRHLAENTHLGWVENRLWVSVPWSDAPTFDRGVTFVFDPTARQGGSWTKFSLAAGPFMENRRVDSFVASILGTSRVYKLDVYEQFFDDFGGSTGIQTIDAYYRTKWIDLEQPAVKKRWKRMEAVMQVDEAYELPVVTYKNYDPSYTDKNFKFVAVGSPTATAEGVWDNPASDWDSASWARNGQIGEVDRGGNLGVSRAVSVQIGGKVVSTAVAGSTQGPVFWGVDALIIKYVPRRVR